MQAGETTSRALNVLDDVPLAIWFTREDGRIEVMNDAARQLQQLGESGSNARVQDAFPQPNGHARERDGSIDWRRVPGELATHGHFSCTARHSGSAQASWHHVEVHPRRDSSGWVVLARPLSGAERSVLSGNGLERIYGSALALADVGLWRSDSVTDEVVLSEHCLELLGFPPDAKPGADEALEAIHPDDRGAVSEAAANAIKERTGFLLRFRLARGDRVLEAFGEPLTDRDGAVIGLTGGLRDLGRELALSQRVTELHARLEQSQKMDAVGQLAAGVAHDFNNLLTAILGNADMVELRLKPAGLALEHLEQIRQAIGQAAELTSQLLAFGKRQPYRPRPVTFERSIERGLNLLRRMVPEQVAIRFIKKAFDNVVFADPAQLRQVLMNLVVNAAQAMPQGGEVTITVDANQTHVLLEVSDQGPGIDDSVQDRIFDAFFTTREAGTGLGLTTVSDIVARHKGDISVTSTPGDGATFLVKFPLCEENPADTEVTSGKQLPQGNGETILVVEDQLLVRSLAGNMLTANGYKVLSAGSARAALDEVAEGAKVDLLLSDVVMLGDTGPDLARKLRSKFPSLPVVYMSGYSGDVLTTRGMIEEDSKLVPKPFTAGALITAVHDALERTRN